MNGDGTTSWIWYYERLEGVRAAELVFRGDELQRVGEVVRMPQESIDYGAIPAPLQPDTWLRFPEPAGASGTGLLLVPCGPVRIGARYDQTACSRLVVGQTTLEDARHQLGGSPIWIADYEDGSRIACWLQLTPTRSTTHCLEFGPEGTLAAVLRGSLHIAGIPGGPPDACRTGAQRVRIDELVPLSR